MTDIGGGSTMTDDLVKRLRAGGNDPTHNAHLMLHNAHLLLKAADEIERLQERVAELEKEKALQLRGE